MPLLRRSHDHHREVPTRRNSTLPAEPANASNEDRHLMTPSLPIEDRYHAYSCRLTTRRAQPRILAFNSQTTAPENAPPNPRRALSHQLPHPVWPAKPSPHPSISLNSTAPVPK